MDARRGFQASTAERVGAYEVQDLLGRGATATVYQCRHAALGRLVAVKVLHPHVARNPVALKRFVREGRALSRIAHPNVVEVFDVGDHEGTPYLVMSLVEGEDLGAHLRRHDPMSASMIADCILPALWGIATAHEAGVIHRDLKPSNIRMTRDHQGRPVPKVLDFGVSKLDGDDGESDLTETEGVLGTVSYMAPEQLRSARNVDARSDVYSLGVILYECATGRRPFRGESRYDVMHAILTAPVEPPTRLRPDLPREFEEAILRAMERKACSRYGSVRELGAALAPFASSRPTWLDGFEPAGRLHSPHETGGSHSEMPSFTLASHSNEAGARGRRPLATLAIRAAAVAAATVAALTLWSHRPAGTTSPAAATRGPARVEEGLPNPSVRNVLLVDAPPALVPATAASSPTNPSSTIGLRTRRAVPPPSARTIPSALPAAMPVLEEHGANGAPILE
jgi:serine/threonine protein kinase